MEGEGASGEAVSGDKRPIKLAAVVIGIALFILGFMITVSSLSSEGTGGDGGLSGGALATGGSSGSLTLLMLLGMVVSFSGVILATVAPMASFIQGKAR